VSGWDLSGTLLRLVILLGAMAWVPIWRRQAGGRTRTYVAIAISLLLLIVGEGMELYEGAAGVSDEVLAWPRVYLQAAGYMGVLGAFLLWVRDVRDSKREAASRLALERRRLDEVRLNEAKLRAILNCASEYCIVVCDSQGLVTSYSDGGERVLGWKAEEVVGKRRVASFQPPDRPVAFEAIARAVREKGFYEAETTLLRKDGRAFPALLTVTSLKAPDGSAVGLVGIAKDITQLKEVQDRLRRERDFIQGVIEANEIFVLGLALEDGRITMFNRGAERISGYARQEIIGQGYVARLIAPAERAAAEQWLARRRSGQESTTQQAEVPILTKSGERRLIAWTTSLCRDERGTPTHVVAFGYDLTEQRRMQEGLTQAKEDLERANAELERVAATDFLTGLANRRQATVQFERELARCRRHYTFLGVIMVDLDRFKPVNDRFGHQVGDAVLVHVANLLKRRARASDIVARYGGEEFLLVLPDADRQSAVKVADDLRRLICDDPAKVGDQEVPIRASFGVAEFHPAFDVGVQKLLERADEALYAAKGLGGNRVVSWQQLRSPTAPPSARSTRPSAASPATTRRPSSENSGPWSNASRPEARSRRGTPSASAATPSPSLDAWACKARRSTPSSGPPSFTTSARPASPTPSSTRPNASPWTTGPWSCSTPPSASASSPTWPS
jgi:diguanylate cyclase (GGDEF)-like protein/PAS domain S-box-containing protein